MTTADILTASHPQALEIAQAFGVKDLDFLTKVVITIEAGKEVTIEITNVKPVKIDDAGKALEIIKSHKLMLSKDLSETIRNLP